MGRGGVGMVKRETGREGRRCGGTERGERERTEEERKSRIDMWVPPYSAKTTTMSAKTTSTLVKTGGGKG